MSWRSLIESRRKDLLQQIRETEDLLATMPDYSAYNPCVLRNFGLYPWSAEIFPSAVRVEPSEEEENDEDEDPIDPPMVFDLVSKISSEAVLHFPNRAELSADRVEDLAKALVSMPHERSKHREECRSLAKALTSLKDMADGYRYCIDSHLDDVALSRFCCFSLGALLGLAVGAAVTGFCLEWL